MNTYSVMIVGVGGQGTLLASKLLGNAVISEGYDVKVSEVHGMSQRGGSVITYVRFGDSVASPIVEKGEADLIISFELLEAARYLPYLKKGGRLIVNTQQIDPMPVVTGTVKYPEGLLEKLSAVCDVTAVDALALASQAGTAKAVNVALVGVAAKSMDISADVWHKVIESTVPPRFREVNLKAFDLGFAY